MGLRRMKKLKTEFNKIVALVLVATLCCASPVLADASKKSESKKANATAKKADAKKEASVYSVKKNAVNINIDGYKKKQDIVLTIYEKQSNGKFKAIKKVKKKETKDDTFKFSETLNEKSVFDYGKEYKYIVKSKEYYVENKNLSDYMKSGYSLNSSNKLLSGQTDKKLSDGDKANLKNCGKLLSFKHKSSKDSKTFKTVSKRKRLLAFSKTYKKVIYSQAKRHQKGFADCSSFVYALYKDIGMDLGGDGANTETELRWCECNALKVKIGSAKLGDVIFYSDEDEDTFEEHYKHVTHVAMFKNNTEIMEMSGRGVNFRTRKVSAYDRDCIAVYRPIFDSKDMKDKDPSKQNIKKSKKEKKDEKLLKKSKKNRKKKVKTNKKTPSRKQNESQSNIVYVEGDSNSKNNMEKMQ